MEDGDGDGDLAADLPLAWLLGRWRGEGVHAGAAPGDPDLAVTVEAEFTSTGGPVLAYRSRTLLGSGQGELRAEQGYWRATPQGLEVVLAHSSGVLEVLVGSPAGTRVELGSDLVARTATGAPDTASTRLYGLVDGRLLFAVDVASGGQPLQPRVSGSLERLPGA